VRLLGSGYSGRDLVLLLGGGFLIVSSILELHEMTAGEVRRAQFRPARSVGLTVLQIGLLDIVFSLDSVFTAVGLARRVEVMAAAIVAAVLFMMWVSGAVGNFIERHPGLKVVALAFLVVIGAALIADAIHRPLPQGTLYFALAFASAVELINIQVRRSGARPPADDG
jgi:predicted tellurium resistance membrane protein TerC